MSGIELAGLILGAIPLAIAALEHYEGGLGKIKAFLKWEDELASAIRTLYVQFSSYELSLKVLLSTVLSQQALNDFLTEAGALTWTGTDVEGLLEEKLATGASAFMLTLQDIETVLKELLICLNLDIAANAPAGDLQATIQAYPRKQGTANDHFNKGYQFNKRLKFTMKKRTIKSLLAQMEQSIGRLDNFNDKAEKLEPYQSKHKARFSTPLNIVQQSAAVLYTSISRVLSCSAHPSHATNLRLEQRMRVRPSKAQTAILGTNKTVFTLSLADGPAYPTLRVAEVIVKEDDSTVRTGKIKVQIIAPETASSSDPETTTVASHAEIIDICSTLCSWHLHPVCARFHMDSSGKLTGVFPSQQSLLLDDAEFVTLKDILMTPPSGTSHPSGAVLTKQDSYTLSVTLSSSILQLQSTPWLMQPLNKSDLAFVRRRQLRSDGSSSDELQLSEPFLMHVHPGQLGSQANSHSPDVHSSLMLSLGVMLLELYCKKPIEHIPTTLPIPGSTSMQQDDLHKLGLVKTWMREEKGNLSWAFQHAVSHCLRCFADPAADLQNDDFRQGVIEGVLAPLQDELSMLFHGPIKW